MKRIFIITIAVCVALTEKYEEPKGNLPIWKDDLYKNDPDDWGFAISTGHLSYCAGWELDNTTIYLSLYGDNLDISMLLTYVSNKYESDTDTKNGL